MIAQADLDRLEVLEARNEEIERLLAVVLSKCEERVAEAEAKTKDMRMALSMIGSATRAALGEDEAELPTPS